MQGLPDSLICKSTQKTWSLVALTGCRGFVVTGGKEEGGGRLLRSWSIDQVGGTMAAQRVYYTCFVLLRSVSKGTRMVSRNARRLAASLLLMGRLLVVLAFLLVLVRVAVEVLPPLS